MNFLSLLQPDKNNLNRKRGTMHQPSHFGGTAKGYKDGQWVINFTKTFTYFLTIPDTPKQMNHNPKQKNKNINL